MEMPNVRHTARDEARNLTFHVMAYRALTREEVAGAVRYWFTQLRKKKAPKNQTITILTVFGATPNL
jgi:hypothetical protein